MAPTVCPTLFFSHEKSQVSNYAQISVDLSLKLQLHHVFISDVGMRHSGAFLHTSSITCRLLPHPSMEDTCMCQQALILASNHLFNSRLISIIHWLKRRTPLQSLRRVQWSSPSKTLFPLCLQMHGYILHLVITA